MFSHLSEFASLSPEMFEKIARYLPYKPALSRLSRTSKELNRIVSESDAGVLAKQLHDLKPSMTKEFLTSGNFELLILGSVIAGQFVGLLGGAYVGYTRPFVNAPVRSWAKAYISSDTSGKCASACAAAMCGWFSAPVISPFFAGGVGGALIGGVKGAIEGSLSAVPYFVVPYSCTSLKLMSVAICETFTKGSPIAIYNFMVAMGTNNQKGDLYLDKLGMFAEKYRDRTSRLEREKIQRLLSEPYCKPIVKKSCVIL